MKFSITAIVLAFCVSCATGKYQINPPKERLNVNYTVVEKDMGSVWQAAIPRLGKHFYVINNMDKSSGFMNLSFSTDPAGYVDCGVLESTVKYGGKPRSYSVDLSKSTNFYEIADGGHLVKFDRKLRLEGKINLIFESLDKNKTKVTANTNYTVSRTVATVSSQLDGNFNPIHTQYADNTGFTTNTKGYFPTGGQSYCVSTGELERNLIELITGSSAVIAPK